MLTKEQLEEAMEILDMQAQVDWLNCRDFLRRAGAAEQAIVAAVTRDPEAGAGPRLTVPLGALRGKLLELPEVQEFLRDYEDKQDRARQVVH